MKKLVVKVRNAEDFSGSDGLWINEKSVTYPDKKVVTITRSGGLWNSINRRCRLGLTSAEYSAYSKSQNLFENFQMFVDWCKNEFGYLNIDPHGKYWVIDKDILVSGNKNYGPEFCMFVPASINNLLVSCNSRRGKYPIGVSAYKKSGKYRADCSDEGIKSLLGYFKTSQEAHRAWQLEKARVILKHYSDNDSLGEKLQNALKIRHDIIMSDYDNNLETKTL